MAESQSINLLSLPPELLRRILEIGGEIAGFKSQQLYLRSSLVCRAMSEEARALLWREISILKVHTAWGILHSKALGTYPTLTLAFYGDYLPLYLVQDIVARVRGVRTLRFARFKKFEMDVLRASSLIGLQTLVLSNVVLHHGTAYGVPYSTNLDHPSFALHKLELVKVDSSKLPSSFNWSRVTSALGELSLGYNNPAPLELLSYIAPHLRRLELYYPTPVIIATLSSFTNLSHLLLDCTNLQLVEIARLLPSRLECLTVWPEDYEDLKATIIAIDAAIGTLKLANPAVLSLPSLVRDETLKVDGAKKFIERLNGLGLVVKFGWEKIDSGNQEDGAGQEEGTRELLIGL